MEIIEYPVSFSVDYPDQPLNRLTTFFRIFVAIPILIVIGLIMGASSSWTANGWSYTMAGGGILFLPLLLMILFHQKYPRWWFDWNLALVRFGARVTVYLNLLRDEYPSTDDEQSVHVELIYPDVKVGLNRWLPLVKWFLAIPHYIVLACLYIATFVVVVIAWFAILINRRYPRGMFDFVVGVLRWNIRVIAYAFMLTTDKYPPFSLN